jgi:hypothetical protein
VSLKALGIPVARPESVNQESRIKRPCGDALFDDDE